MSWDARGDDAPITRRALELVDFARESEEPEPTVVIPASLLLSLRARAACDDPPASVEVVEIDPDDIILEEEAYEQPAPSSGFLRDPHEDVERHDIDDDIDIAFDSLVG